MLEKAFYSAFLNSLMLKDQEPLRTVLLLNVCSLLILIVKFYVVYLFLIPSNVLYHYQGSQQS